MNKTSYKKLAIDSMVMIYLLEQNQNYLGKIVEAFHKADQILISSFLYGEVLTGFYREKEYDFAEKLIAFAEASEKIKICNFDLETATHFAKLRSETKLSPPDCIHLANALRYKADVFLTNDKAIKNIKGLELIQLSKL